MQFAIRIICNRRMTETIKERVKELANYLCLPTDFTFSPYWKDDECDVLELDTKIDHPDYSKIKQYVLAISGAESIFQKGDEDDREFAYFASLDKLHSSKDTAFVDCNIFKLS